MKKYIFTAILTCVCAVISPQTVFGQWDYGQSIYDNIVEARIDRRKTEARMEARRRGNSNRPANSGGRPGTKSAGTTAPAADVVRGETTFSPTGALIVPKELAQKYGKTAQEKREAEVAFTKSLGIYENFLKSKGYASNDMARVSSSLFITCMLSYTNRDLTQKQRDGIYESFRDYYETDADFQALGDREKQKNYETNGLLWAFVSTISIAAEEKGDPKSLQKAKETAENIFRRFTGISIGSIRLTADGFEID